MQGAEERRRLIGQLEAESISPLRAVLKCAAGILVLVIVAAGPWAVLSAGGPTTANGGHPASMADAAQAEAKQVFDERRRVYEVSRQNGAPDRLTATHDQPEVE